jgi:hypothetical protein
MQSWWESIRPFDKADIFLKREDLLSSNEGECFYIVDPIEVKVVYIPNISSVTIIIGIRRTADGIRNIWRKESLDESRLTGTEISEEPYTISWLERDL